MTLAVGSLEGFRERLHAFSPAHRPFPSGPELGVTAAKALLPLRLGTALWGEEGRPPREVLVAPLPSDPGRLVDLNGLERARLARLGEGRPERLAEALVPASLLEALQAGPRVLPRLRQALAYAEKWHRRGDLPEELAPARGMVRLLPCLPRPAALRRADGTCLDPQRIQGPGGTLHRPPQPTLAALGLHGGRAAGFCLAVEDVQGALLGPWLEVDFPWRGHLELQAGGRTRTAPLEAWGGLVLPALGPGEALLLPPPRLRPLPGLEPGAELTLRAGGEPMRFALAPELVHPTLQ